MDTTAHNLSQLLQHDTETHGLLRLVTAGSVDDGKSTLIGRLLYESKGIFEDQLEAVASASSRRGSAGGQLDLSLVTDGLKAEREQGITIDVAYRYFATPRRKFIIADTPGHEQYTRNMVTGASTADVVIILIDARHGVVTQSRRHAFLASLLGIKHMVVAINKMDLVGYGRDVYDQIARDFTEFATRLDIPDITFIPMSALVGDNVTTRTTNMPWYEGTSLLHHLETVHIASDRNLVDLRFPVQYVTRPDLHFRGYMGTPASGIVRPGDEVVALPSGVRSRIMRVIGAGGDVAEAFPPMAVTLTLADDIDVSRGDVLVRPNNVPRVSNTFESMLVWMAADAMRPGRQYVVKHGTRKVPAFIKSIRYRVDVNTLHRHAAGELGLNEIGRCELELARPIAFDAYLKNRASGSFIVIDRETHNTVGAGMILDRERIEPSRDATTATMPAASRATDRGASLVTASERRERLRQTAFVVVLTGDDAAATVAYAVERELFNAGLIGHVVRTGDAAKLLCDAGLVAICVADGDGRVGQSIDADRVLEVTAGELAAAPAQIMNQLRARGWA